MSEFLLVAAIAYGLGSIPFGLLIARWVAGVDLRTVGSGNIGATNVFRVLGKYWGTVALLLDAAKGGVPTACLPGMLGIEAGSLLPASVLAGVCAVLGHMFSPWLRFRGGKGVATATGVVIVLAPWGFLAAFTVFVLLFATTRIVSLGSMAAAATFAASQVLILWPNLWTAERWTLSAFSLGVPALIVYQHRSNIGRLMRGEEHAFRKRTDSTAPSGNQGDTPPAS